MKITIYEMRLFNDTSQKQDTSFILNRKEWRKSKTETERDRVKSERRNVAEKGLQRGS